MQFIEEHLKYELLAVLILLPIRTAIAFRRAFSRRPGAQYSLAQVENLDAERHAEGNAWEVTRAAVERLIASGARPFVVLPRLPGLDANQTQHDAALDTTSANYPFPLPLILVLATVDTCVVLFTTLRWIPDIRSPFLLLIIPVNGLLIALLMALQMWFLVWLRNRFRLKMAARSQGGTPLS